MINIFWILIRLYTIRLHSLLKVIKQKKNYFLIVKYVKKKYEDEEIQNKYLEAVEELITIVDLHEYINQLDLNELKQVLKDVDLYYKLEMNEEE